MFSWLASFLVFFLHNNSATVTSTVQQNSTGAAITQTLHEAPAGNVPIGDGNSNGTPG
jgi:hypothetical protein